MTFIQDWGAPNNNDWGTSETRTGPTTQAGNTLFADLYIRSSTPPPATVTVADNGATGTNLWELVESHQDSSTNMFMFICRDAEPVTAITFAWLDATDATINAEHMGFLTEYSAVGELIGATAQGLVNGGLPDPVTLSAGQLIRGIGAQQSIARTWAITSTGVTPTERPGFTNLQSVMHRADAYAGGAGDASIGWTLVSGSSGSFFIINAAFAEPAPLAVDAGTDTAAYVGVPVAVTATATGGSGPRIYTWSSNGDGTFGDTTSATTTYTPQAAGEHILECNVVDSVESVSDTVTVTATAIPTENFTAAAGWTSVIGAANRLAALTDSDDDSYVETGEAPDGETITLTLPPMERPLGDLTVPLRLSTTGASTVNIAPVLTTPEGDITATTVTVAGPVQSYAAVFTAAQLAGTTGWGSGLTVTLTATVD